MMDSPYKKQFEDKSNFTDYVFPRMEVGTRFMFHSRLGHLRKKMPGWEVHNYKINGIVTKVDEFFLYVNTANCGEHILPIKKENAND